MMKALSLGIVSMLAILFNTNLSAQCNYYYADMKYGGPREKTDIYSVSLNGSNADLTHLITLNGLFHIAFDSDNEQLYLFHERDSYFLTYDVTNGNVGPQITTSPKLKKITQAVFSPDGNLVVGDQNNGTVYTIDITTGAATHYVTNTGANSGDLVYLDNGDLMSLSSTNFSELNRLTAPSTTSFVGRLPQNLINGAALMPNGNIMTSYGNSYDFYEVDPATGNAIGNAYTATLNGSPFRLNNSGDMAGGCIDTTTPPTPLCDYAYFLSRNTENGGEIYGVNLNGTDANLTYLFATNTNTQIAFDEANTELYLISNYRVSPSTLRIYNVVTGYISRATIINGVENITQADFQNGQLYIGSEDDEFIYTLDPATGTITMVAGRDITSGDLVFNATGTLLSGSNTKFDIEAVALNGSGNTVTATYTGNLVGLALMETGNLLASNQGEQVLHELDATGNATGTTYNLKLNGAAFTQGEGDMAKGCSGNSTNLRDAGSIVLNTDSKAFGSNNALTVYPNPAQGQVTVAYTADATATVEIQLYNVVGAMVYSTFSNGQEKTTIDITDLQAGMYLVNVLIDGQSQATTRLVISNK